MEIKRDLYLNKLIQHKKNGMVKIITGVRRSGKSYLLFRLFRDYLFENGVNENHIISLALDDFGNRKLQNPDELYNYVKSRILDKEDYYILLDEIQLVPEFESVINGFLHIPNADIYVTGSNSKFLSSDIITEFRGRGDEIRVYPLNFSEFYSVYGGDFDKAWIMYCNYGGMPLCLSRPNDSARTRYLTSLFEEVYLKDIVERHRIEREDILSQTLDLICSSIGSLTNPTKISNTLKTVQQVSVSQNTIKAYIGYLEDSYLFSESKRYDVKGKSYFDFPYKYYCEDVGLRNARVGFRQLEMTHIMENIIYNELVIRGYQVDVGVVYSRELDKNKNSVRIPREIDFVINDGSKRVYIQSAYAMETEEKQASELRPFALTGDSFPKIIIRHDVGKRWYDDKGVLNIGIIDFLLDDTVV